MEERLERIGSETDNDDDDGDDDDNGEEEEKKENHTRGNQAERGWGYQHRSGRGVSILCAAFPHSITTTLARRERIRSSATFRYREGDYHRAAAQGRNVCQTTNPFFSVLLLPLCSALLRLSLRYMRL